MTSPEETMVDYSQVFDKLVSEISSAQAELDMIQEQLRNQRSIDSVGLEAATLQEETKLWKKETPEGFVEDDQIRYYLAVGQVEELVKEMRDIKEITGKSLAGTKDTLNMLNKTIKEQAEIVKSLEDELAGAQEKTVEEEASDFNLAKRKELNDNTRWNKMIVKQMKNDLKSFIDQTAKLDPDFNPADGSSFGYLLQALWKNFLDHGPSEYISIEALDFDVPQEVLEQLVRADVVQEHPSNPDKIKMVDFTMSN
eukprot:TRINITY_DN61610_c0_g1_i1.p1 TRINITY_DN61610_c0_g1~~TRINITY_DN61610_c0_g1_i1.p1  ORF type:complete len:254 (-),score=102.69 TRINITY_DN61610_c0_g1_i1:143-904(-)